MLDGVRVLDLSRLLPGPAATAWLAGQGAVVDRVEAPGRGDFTRHIPPFVDGMGSYFCATSRGKRSLALDLRRPEAGALIRSILPTYDVLVEGFKPGVLEAMGLGPDVLHAVNPRLVIARISGFGQAGPWSDRPGHDVNYLGLAGVLHATGRSPDGIVLPTVQVADMGGAMIAAAGVASALFERERTGKGRVLDVSLADAALWFFGPVAVGSTGEGDDGSPGGLPLAGGLPIYGTFACADGRWITLGALEGKFQAVLAAHVDGDLGREELATFFRSKPRDAWVDLLADACVGPVLAPSELADHPQWASRRMITRAHGASWVQPPLGELPVDGAFAAVGEHSDVVLTGAGVSMADVAALRAAGVVA